MALSGEAFGDTKFLSADWRCEAYVMLLGLDAPATSRVYRTNSLLVSDAMLRRASLLARKDQQHGHTELAGRT
jgi:hypothetical protein